MAFWLILLCLVDKINALKVIVGFQIMIYALIFVCISETIVKVEI